MTTTPKFSLREKAAEARRECNMRRKVYTRNGTQKMRYDDERRLAMMEEIAEDYELKIARDAPADLFSAAGEAGK